MCNIDKLLSRARFNPQIRWAVYVFIALLCLYRLAHAVPQPLDSPGTLRPILFDLFDRYLDQFDRRETAFYLWRALCYVALLLPPMLAILHYLHRIKRKALGSRWLFFATIAACLVLCRFPTLLENEFNPDEGQFLASAHKLFFDPNFFHAVDESTNGPINIYPLMLPAILGFSPDFASSRVIVMAIILLSACLLYRSVATVASEELARIVVVPFAGAFAVFKNSELLHYSSEHIPTLLISLGLYWSVRVVKNPDNYVTLLFGLGLLVSAAFFAKMQSVPILGAEAGVALACVYLTGHAGSAWRPALALVAGAVPLPAINAILCVSAGVWGDFWMSYIRANSSYPNTGGTLLQNAKRFAWFVYASREVFLFLLMVVGFGIVCLAGGKRGHSVKTDAVSWFGWVAGTSLLASFYAVYVPHRTFFHYLLLLFVPLCACLAWMLLRRHSVAIAGLLVALVVGYQSYLWKFQDDHVFKNVASTIRPPEGEFIRTLTSPQGRIFVWGWTMAPYLGSGHVSATRDFNVSNCFRAYNLMTFPPVIDWTPASRQVSNYYVKRIAHDLRAGPPEVFIDAIGPTSWFLVDPKYYGFEQFPEIASFVKSNYKLLTSYNYQRYYVRRDRIE